MGAGAHAAHQEPRRRVEALDHGPTNWARVRVVEAPERGPGSAISHRVIFAFDTELMERRQNRPYTAPSREDASNDHEFRFAYSFDIAWFLGAPIPGDEGRMLAGFQDWVPAWLSEMFREFKQALNPDRPLRAGDFPMRWRTAPAISLSSNCSRSR